MLTNPGGPGGSGLPYAALGKHVPKNAGASYDWIGFDPRGGRLEHTVAVLPAELLLSSSGKSVGLWVELQPAEVKVDGGLEVLAVAAG